MFCCSVAGAGAADVGVEVEQCYFDLVSDVEALWVLWLVQVVVQSNGVSSPQ